MRRKGITVMGKLIGLIKPLVHIMLFAILLGTAGNLCAIAITVLGGYAILEVLGIHTVFPRGSIFLILCICAVSRGLLRYGEQTCNHYIAFKLLALIRHQVFTALRKLAPAKLEGREKGNLISLITSDIELLEVFYAHTVSPVVIAVITSAVISVYLGSYHVIYGVIAVTGYFIIGAVFPILLSKAGNGQGLICRNSIGEMNSFLLESLRGLTEILQYHSGEKRQEEMKQRTSDLENKQKKIKNLEGITKIMNESGVILFSMMVLIAGILLYHNGKVAFDDVFIPFLTIMSSFGPVVALSNLSNNLTYTLASGNRVLDLLEESPAVTEVTGEETVEFNGAACEAVSFDYGAGNVLKDISVSFETNKIIGIHGRSGCGKSTLLKMLMRFFDAREGKVMVSHRDIRQVNTKNLREMESYVTQETHLFHASIAENIGMAKEGATREEIEAAAKKASLHEFIESLPEGYDTNVGELGDKLSGGERQRIGIARAFLKDAPFLLLDEPTSNLDSLNEGIILKSLLEESGEKTVVLVSHKATTMNIADIVYRM